MLRGFLFDLGGTLYHFHGASEKDLFHLGARQSYEYLRDGHGLDLGFGEYLRRVRRSFVPQLLWSLASGRELDPRRIYPRIAWRLGLDGAAIPWHELELAWFAPVRDRLGLIEGGRELLEALRGRGVRLGIISNIMFHPDLAMEQLDKLGIREYFETFTFSSELGYRKPHRRIYLDALDKLGLPPREVGFVGNLLREDVRGPERLGMRAILYAPRPRRLRLGRPRFQAASLHEVREIALRWCQPGGGRVMAAPG